MSHHNTSRNFSTLTYSAYDCMHKTTANVPCKYTNYTILMTVDNCLSQTVDDYQMCHHWETAQSNLQAIILPLPNRKQITHLGKDGICETAGPHGRNHMSFTHHHVRIIYQWIEEVCGLNQWESSVSQWNHTAVHSNTWTRAAEIKLYLFDVYLFLLVVNLNQDSLENCLID